DWIDGYRLARIVEMIQGRSDWDVAGVQRMQMDQYSLPWEELRGRVLAAPGNDPETRRALDLLSAWDGRVSAGSPAAAVFEFFLHEMGRRLAQTKAPRSCQWVVGGGFGRLIPVTSFAFRRVGHLVRLLSDQPEGWISRPWTEEVADALGAAVRRLSSLHGPSPARWAWGRIRPLTLEHYAGQRKPLDRLFNLGPIPWGGDANTVSQASVDPVSASDNPGFISSMRMVVDVGAWSQSRFVIPAGQSANPLSPHYADQLPLWQRGQGVPIPWTKEEVDQATRHRLWLFPAVR
ncbi:MAG: penicillin acylase family protein, partial [Acidimicrobiales bacterium]